MIGWLEARNIPEEYFYRTYVMREPSCFWLPMLVRSFASLESSMIKSRDDRPAESSQAVVSEDQVSTISVSGSRSR